MSANATSNMFLGRLGKKKNYSWMNAGNKSATPAYDMPSGGNIRTAAAAAAAAQQAPVELTQRSQTRLGFWREDKSSGDKVQMRDWIAVMEQDGCAHKELQRALTWLDGTRPKKPTPESQ